MLTILIVDDDVGTRLFTGDYLEANGYGVLTAENGEEALKLVRAYQPHLIITDITMPTMDGYNFVKQVRQCPGMRLIPVIFLTGRTEVADRILGYQAGGDVYLPKPFELSELGAVVRNLLERTQLIEAEWRFNQHRTGPTAEGYPATRSALAVAAEYEQPAAHLPAHLHPPNPDLHLTERESAVLKILAEGHSNGQIGNQLHLSARTVEKYVSSLLRKTSTSNRAELVRYVMEHQLVR
jgi:DNA-binding NarL/FixJ family response regulator